MSLLLSVAAVRQQARQGWRRASRSLLSLLFWLFLGLWVGALALWLGLHWLILPRLDEWRPQVEAQASRALGHPVQIGRIAAQGAGWVPAFVLQDVVLRDARGREALRLPQVSAALSVPSLLALRLRFDQLLIEDARLEVRRDAQGRWHVAGLDVDLTQTAGEAGVDGGAAADWLFEQHEFVIRGGVLRWVDELRGAAPLQLNDVLLVMRNPGRRHEFRLDATPPAGWGQRFSLRALARSPLLARPGDWQRWKGTLYADLPDVDVNGLRQHVDLPVDLQHGQATLRAWVDWDQALPLALTLEAAMRDVSVRLAPALPPLAFQQLSGRFVAERSAGGVALAVDRLAFTTGDGQGWLPSQLSARWRQQQAMRLAEVGASHPVTGGELNADRLDLAALADLAERLPIGQGLRELLNQLNPEGTVRGLAARWDGPLDAPRTYSVRAQVNGLAIAAAPSPEAGGIGRPGWRGADLSLQATEAGGQAALGLADGAIELPGVFEPATVALAKFAAQLHWRIQPVRVATAAAALPKAGSSGAASDAEPRIELSLSGVRFDNADGRGSFEAQWHTGPGSGFGKGGRLPGVLALSGKLDEIQADRVARYLPLGISEHARHWVRRAVTGGTVHDATFRVQGDLWEFPYVNRRDGEFRIAGQLQDVTLAPIPSVAPGEGEPAWDSPWPAFAAVSGELVFERNAMQFQKARMRLWGLALSEVQGRIRELSPQALLEVEGQIRGPASDLLRYLHSTPVGSWTGDGLAQTTVSGVAELGLALNIPLSHSADTQVKAVLQLPGNDVRLRPDLPLLPGARGKVEATQKGFQVMALRTQLAGGEAQIDGGTQADGTLRFDIAGTASAEGLRRTPELGPLVPRLAHRLQGQAAYKALVGLQASHTEWQLASNLQGMAIKLPAPLAKAADLAQPLRLGFIGAIDPLVLATPAGRALGVPAGDARRNLQQDWLRIELGPLQASLVLDHASGGTRLARGAMAFNTKLPEPEAGGVVALTLARLDAEAWRPLAEASAWGVDATPAVAAAASSPAGAASSAPGPAPAEADADWLSAWLPATVRLSATELLISGRRLSDVALDLQRLSTTQDSGWRISGQADQVAGTADFLAPRRAGGAGRVVARLSRLSLPPTEAETMVDAVASLLDQAPTSVPALDIEIDAFELHGRQLGRLAVEAVNQLLPAGRDGVLRSEWRLNKLVLANADARLGASGRWTAQAGPNRRHMALDFTLDVDNGGALLQRLGKGRAVLGAPGQIRGSLGWDGSPLELDIPTLEGRLALAMKAGKFLQADAGAARLLGVLSLQALPRRLLLDFRDVFEEGFNFDSLNGDVQIRQGVARTDNLRVRGAQAVVLLAGQADIGRETQDLQVLALPELNTASASLAYAAVNPAVALGAFIGQWLLGEPLRQASAREFRITGSWDAPKVDRIERSILTPLPPLATRAGAAAADAAQLAAAAAAGAASAAPAPAATPARPASKESSTP